MIKATCCLAFLASCTILEIEAFTLPRARAMFVRTKLTESSADSEKDIADLVSLSPFQTDFPDTKVALIPYQMKDGETARKQVFAPDAVWMTGASQFWAQDLYGEGVTVGVIDSGIDYTHPSLDGRVDPKESRNYCPWDASAGPTEFNPHGTHVAGTIAANSGPGASLNLVGVAPEAKLRDYRVFDRWGFPIRLKDPEKVSREGRNIEFDDVYQPVEFASIARAIRDAVADGCDVINMSLGGGGPNAEIQEAIQEARSKGVAVIVAAGNAGAGKRSYPAAFPETLSVAAVNVKLPEGLVEKVWFSQDDSEVDVAADGFFLISTYPNGQYQLSSGTSMATPCVAGMAALLRESMLKRNRMDGKDGMPDIHDLLRHRAVSVFDGDGRERNEVAGHGLCTFFSEVPAVKGGQWIFPELNNNEPIEIDVGPRGNVVRED